MNESKWAPKPAAPPAPAVEAASQSPTVETPPRLERKPSRVQNLIRMFSSEGLSPTGSGNSPTKAPSPSPSPSARRIASPRIPSPAREEAKEREAKEPETPSKKPASTPRAAAEPEPPAPSTVTTSAAPSAPSAAPAAPAPTTTASTSVLSGAAPAFSPLPSPVPPPPPDVSGLDTFAQTGGAQDDLFFDDVVPVEDAGRRVQEEEDLFSDGFTPVQEKSIAEVHREQQQAVTRGGRGNGERSRGRGRGRGRGLGGGGRGGAIEGAPPEQASTEAQRTEQLPGNAPTGPKNATPMTTPSVRGDRFATGGIRKPKLTEAELEARMAAIQIKNASLTAAHARAEADAQSFAEREAAASQQAEARKKIERRDRQQMMGEREKNRMRKLKALGGREWDSEKNQEDFEKGGQFDGKGFGRDQEGYTDGREYLYQEPRGRGRGRGGRGRGRGQEGRGGNAAPPRMEDFPALPGARSGLMEPEKEGAIKSWADQVESSTNS